MSVEMASKTLIVYMMVTLQ